jgi:hypothetical protein
MNTQRAGIAALVKIFVVVDTSYLLELFQVPGNTNPKAAVVVAQKFQQGINSGVQFFVPLPVLFELGNHIADVPNGGLLRQLALQLKDAVKEWLAGNTPFTVVSSMDDSRTVKDFCVALGSLTQKFSALVPSQHGLTDTAVVVEAERLRSRYIDSSLSKYRVYIWTRHQSLKALEPDTEPTPFV